MSNGSEWDFMSEKNAKEYTERITDIYSGNLIAQNNEISILKLTKIFII